MRYPYVCLQCSHKFDIIKSFREIDNPELCPSCNGNDNKRLVVGGTGFFGEKDWDRAHFSHALGKVVNSHAEEKRIASSMGMEEVGTESPDKLHKYYERKQQEKLDKSYEIKEDDIRNILEESKARP